MTYDEELLETEKDIHHLKDEVDELLNRTTDLKEKEYNQEKVSALQKDLAIHRNKYLALLKETNKMMRRFSEIEYNEEVSKIEELYNLFVNR